MRSDATTKDPVVEELERILASPEFSRSERLTNFLRFVVQQKLQGSADQLKETVIGSEVFGRRPDYDPRSDPVVRMEAAKLRARLTEYYARAGAGNPIRIEVPKGAYIPQWQLGSRAGRITQWKWVATIVLTLCLIVAGIATWRGTRPSGKRTISVLPFVNLSSDPENEYFSDGLTEEIIHSLSSVEGLEVTSKTSSFAFKGARLDAREIASKLKANALLEGSVRKAGDRLRVTAQLIDADGKHIWSNTYDREMRDVFAIQSEIAGSLAATLRLKLGAGHRRYTDNLEAYQLYLRGRYALDRPVPLAQALQYFEQAIAKDANYALAYAGAADAFLKMGGQLTERERFARAKAAAERALQLDPMLSEAHTALGVVRTREYAWQEAERIFRRAIDLNPNNALAHLELGRALVVSQGRFDEGLGEMRRALALDPLSAWTTAQLAYALLSASRYQEAEDQARKAVVLSPVDAIPYQFLGRALSLQGKHTEALTAMQAAVRHAPEGASSGWLACAYARAGQRDQALQVLQENLQRAQKRPVPNRRLVQIYGCLGDRERVFEYLEKMYEEPDGLLPQYLLYPELAWLRSDPRFAALRQRVGLAL